MSHAILKLFGSRTSWRQAELWTKRVATVTATLSIGFLAVLVVAL
jgi:hypothetical protein